MLANLPLLPGMKRNYVQSLRYGTWFDGVNDYVLRTVANFRSSDTSGKIKARRLFWEAAMGDPDEETGGESPDAETDPAGRVGVATVEEVP